MYFKRIGVWIMSGLVFIEHQVNRIRRRGDEKNFENGVVGNIGESPK
jgi:hypothetical protein